MIISDPHKYRLVGFRKRKTANKKYDGIIQNKETGELKHIPFGDKNYQQYKDTTGLGLYTKLNHLDKERRDRYRIRHAGEDKNKFSSGWFSWKYLW